MSIICYFKTFFQKILRDSKIKKYIAGNNSQFIIKIPVAVYLPVKMSVEKMTTSCTK